MVVTGTALALLVGAPLAGILAICALAVLHEHGTVLSTRQRVSVPAPVIRRRASTELLEDYLYEDRTASIVERREHCARFVAPVVRASTDVLEEYLETVGIRPAEPMRRTEAAAPALPAMPVLASSAQRTAPALGRHVPAQRPPLQPAYATARPALQPAPRFARVAARRAQPARLVPLGGRPEIALG